MTNPLIKDLNRRLGKKPRPDSLKDVELSLAVPGDEPRPKVMAALKTGSSALQTCLRTVGGGKVGSLVSDAIDKINEASYIEKSGKGQNLSLSQGQDESKKLIQAAMQANVKAMNAVIKWGGADIDDLFKKSFGILKEALRTVTAVSEDD